MVCTVVVGGFWGDEGKGKIVAYLALKNSIDIAARAGVGPNAGHTVVYKDRTYGLRQIPSAFVNENAKLLIGPGVLINPKVFLEEVEKTKTKNRVFVDYRCGIIEERHIKADAELKKRIGSTGTGCGPAMAERVLRKAKLARDVEELKDYLADVPLIVNEAIDNGDDVLVEGTQGFGLSLYHGYDYPYVTSKDTTASSFAADVGIGPKKIDDVIAIFKAFPTRVGAGPFNTEISREEAKEMGIVEYGTVTGRRRRVGKFDFELAKRAVMINSATQIAITGIDKLDRDCYKVREYEDLTRKARMFVERVEEELKVPVTLISTGPDIFDIVDLREESD